MALRDTQGRYANTRQRAEDAGTITSTRQTLRDPGLRSDLDFINTTKTEVKGQRTAGNQLLDEARKNAQRVDEEMGRLTIDLQEAFVEFGAEVSEAYNYQRSERIWSFFGKFSQGAKNRANQLRMQRLLTQTLDAKIKEIQRLNAKVNADLQKNEDRYDKDRQEYLQKQAVVIEKLRTSQPKLNQAISDREQLEGEVNKLKGELETGAVAEDQRPDKEKELAQLQANLHDAQLDEAEFLAIVKSAQEAIRILEENIGAAQKSIVAIHQMRVAQAQKHDNLLEIFENAMTSVIARASVEQFQVIDPAMNKTATEITRNNVLMAGAAMSTNIERMKKSPIDPEVMRELVSTMKTYVDDWQVGIQELEEQAAQGARADTPVGTVSDLES